MTLDEILDMNNCPKCFECRKALKQNLTVYFTAHILSLLPEEDELLKRIEDFREIEWIVTNDPDDTDEKIDGRALRFAQAILADIKKRIEKEMV